MISCTSSRVGQVVKTPPFHGGITGSNPVPCTNNLEGACMVTNPLLHDDYLSKCIKRYTDI